MVQRELMVNVPFQPKSHTGLQRGLAQKGSVLCIPLPETKPSAIPEWVLQKASNPKLTVPFLQETHFIIKTQGRNHNYSLTPTELQHMWEMSQWLIRPHPSPMVSSHTVNATTVPPPHAASLATLKSKLIHFNMETHWSIKPQFLNLFKFSPRFTSSIKSLLQTSHTFLYILCVFLSTDHNSTTCVSEAFIYWL